MNIGDKLTWAYRTLFILMLIWLRFIEAYIPFWGIWIVWGLILFVIFYQPFKKLGRKQGEKLEERQAQKNQGNSVIG